MGALSTLKGPVDLALFGAKTVFEVIFPSENPDAQILSELTAMLQKQDDLRRSINSLSGVVISSEVSAQINDYLKADRAGLVATYYGALRTIDATLSDGTIDKDTAIDERQKILLTQLPGSAPLGSICEFDELTYFLGMMLTMDYATSLPGKSPTNLFSLYKEWQKRNPSYRWEHQGYEARAAFQNCAVSQYITAASIDTLSLSARINAIQNESEKVLLSQRLSMLAEQTKLVQDMYNSMKVTPRSESERYYQVPGHEKLLWANVPRAVIPTEDWGVGLLTPWNIKGLVVGGLHPHAITSFWELYANKNTVPYCDIENFTGAKINDDLIIKGTDYFVEAHPDGGITLRLSNDLLDALPDGQHSLHLYFTDGHGEILFDADSLSSDSSAAVSSVPDVPATGDAPRALILLPVMALLLTALLPLKKKAYSISK